MRSRLIVSDEMYRVLIPTNDLFDYAQNQSLHVLMDSLFHYYSPRMMEFDPKIRVVWSHYLAGVAIGAATTGLTSSENPFLPKDDKESLVEIALPVGLVEAVAKAFEDHKSQLLYYWHLMPEKENTQS